MPKFTPTKSAAEHVVADGRFALLPVNSKISIRDFVNTSGITFKPGRGFYQLTKPETIQSYKEIVAVRVSDKVTVSGDKVRELLKIPSGAQKFKYNPVPDFDVFVQSTSYNRVLMPDTQFLYEVDESKRGTPSPSKGALKKVDVAGRETRNAPPPASSVGSPIELVFSFDTTGSMYSCLTEVRNNLEQMIKRIMKDIPNIKIAVFAHGDYCDDRPGSYVTTFENFTTNEAKLCKFVRDVKATGGGDFPECYELVLKEVREKLKWTPGSQRALVMIGDATPHSVEEYKQRKNDHHYKPVIDWRVETDRLADMGCRIYAVQAHPHSYATSDCDRFYAALAYKTYGHHLNLNSFSNVFDFIMAICYREQGPEQLEAYRQEVIKRSSGPGGKGLNDDLHALFDDLGADEYGDSSAPTVDSVKKSLFSDEPSTSKKGGRKRAAPSATACSPAKKSKATTKVAVKTVAPKRKAAVVAKKVAVKKAPARKTATKKTPVKKALIKKAPAKTALAKNAPVKKAKNAPVKNAPAKKVPVKKAAKKAAPAKKATPKKQAVKKTAVPKRATNAAAKKAPAKKATTKNGPAKRGKK